MHTGNKDSDFDALIDEYCHKITDDKWGNNRPVLNCFKRTILNRHKAAPSVDEIFMHRIVGPDIVAAGIEYIDQTPRIHSESAIRKYLLAITDFNKKIIRLHYQNSSLNSVLNFQSLFLSIKNGITKKLAPISSYSHIAEEEYDLIKLHIQKIKKIPDKNFSISVIYRMILLFGFKIETVESMVKDNYDDVKRVLNLNPNFTEYKIALEIPYDLANDLSIQKKKCSASNFLFTYDDGKNIDGRYFTDDLKVLKKEARDLKLNSSCFTLTGFSKYAVINMLVEGLNPLAVREVSGVKDTDFKYCEVEAMKILQNEGLSHHINSHIRDIETFDDFQ